MVPCGQTGAVTGFAEACAATRVCETSPHLAGIQDISESTCHRAAVGHCLSELNALFGVIW